MTTPQEPEGRKLPTDPEAGGASGYGNGELLSDDGRFPGSDASTAGPGQQIEAGEG